MKLSAKLFVFCALVILVSAPTLTAHAAPALQEAPPVDWNAILYQVLSYAVPILVMALVAQAVAGGRYWWGRLEIERPDIVTLLDQAAHYAAPVVEQLKKNGTIPDNATAKEIEADGFKRAEIKRAEGLKQHAILVAEGQAESIKLINESASKYFTGNAVELKKIEAVVSSLERNSKIILPEGKSLINVIGDLVGKEQQQQLTMLKPS